MTVLVNPPDRLTELRKLVTNRIIKILRRSADFGFLGTMPIADQVDHALGFVFTAETTLGKPPESVVDLGTGGGIPGLILLACWPESEVVLLDANERRTEFLSSETMALSRPGNVVIVRGRAEEVGHFDEWRGHFDLVSSRSFGSPGVVAECGAPLLKVGGCLVVSEPPGGVFESPSEGRWSEDGLLQVGMRLGHQVDFDGRFGYQTLIQEELTPDRFPRRVGVPTKRPLF